MKGMLDGHREIPASAMQTLFWRMQTTDPSSRDHLVVTGFRISGSLQVDLLRKSLEAVIASEPALRTVFIERDGDPVQRILPHMPLAWEQVEVPSVEPPEDIEGLRTLFRDFRSQTFDLDRGPLMRVRLLSAGREDHLLQIAVHHIVSDGTSMTVLLDAVSSSYNALLHGRETIIDQPSDANGGFALQERQWLSGEEGRQSLEYWCRRLQKRGLLHPWPSWGGIPDLSERAKGPSGTLEWSFDGSLSMGIGRLASLCRTSRFRVMLGTYLLSLQKMLPARSVTVGVTMDMRRLSEERPSIGCLINTLPVTLDGEPVKKVEEHLRIAAREVDDAIAHSRVPYPDMLEAWVKRERGLRSARWRTLFNLKDTESGRLGLEGCTCVKVHEYLNEVLQDDRSSDLSITMTRTPGDRDDRPIRMLLRYDGNALSGQQVEAIVESWESVLRQCIAAPDAEVHSIVLPGIMGRHAEWQQALASPDTRKRLETYWKNRLSDLGEPATLLPDLAPKNETSGRMGCLTRRLDASIHTRMDDYCRREGLSRSTAWMSIWQILQARLGTGKEVMVTVPVTEPGKSVQKNTSDEYLNILPIRTIINEKDSFRTYTHSYHDSVVRDLTHSQLPLGDIIRLADDGQGMNGHGLPQVMFAWHGEYEWGEEDDMSLDISPKTRHARNPISIHLTDRGDASRVTLEYDADLFSENTAEAILRRFESVARQVLVNPDARIEKIDILLPGERERLHELSGRDNKVDYPQTTLHDIFHHTASLHPYRPAVIEADGRQTSYAELQEQVLKVAAYLRAQGIEKESVVAVHMNRSPALLASMLGILEVEGVFLLMEPSLPLDRLRTMAEQARVTALITEGEMPVIPGFSGCTHRFNDILSSDVAYGFIGGHLYDTGMLAYVMFTSGSTGVPKGAMVEHGNIVNRLSYTRDAMRFGHEDRTLQKSPLSFDVCLTELLMPMFTGGAVVLADPGIGIDVQRIADLVALHRATYLHFVPGVLQAFLYVPDVKKVNGILKMIRCGGESLPEATMRSCLDTLDATLFQSYGPAETAVAVTLWECHSGHGHPKPPIGRPNANVDILIMDIHGRAVPPGMPGELWIGGAQTGRGYVNNEKETRKSFVDDPMEPGSGRRYYRTGDLARFMPDGNILFVGRMDDQLKVRGVRIELGDVTAALNKCEGVKDAVVLPEPDSEGSNRLRGWVTLKNGVDVSEPAIRASLIELLPGYMVPFRIHVVDSIPLTTHGKTDHRSLRALADLDAADADAGLPLETETQRTLAGIWAELLRVEVKSRDADFFRLGGHSLVAMRLAGRIQKSYKVKVSLPDFYNDGRLDRLAARIDAEHDGDMEGPILSDLPALVPGERVPMSWAQRRMWMLQQLLSNPSSYHIAHVFTIPRERSASDVKSILESMADRHGILRTRLFQEDDGFWQEELPADEWKMEWLGFDATSEGQITELLSKQRERAFDLGKAPGWRAGWIEGRSVEPLLLVVFHHALMDEWSMNLFKREFDSLLTGNAPSSESSKPSHSYIDFSRWQHWTFSKGLRERLETYWKGRLSGLGEPIRLSPDFQPREGRSGRSGAVTRPVEASIQSMMEAYCKREGLSRFSVWMSAWQILQARLGTGEEVVLATPVSERDRSEWHDVMGMCLNTLPIRTKVDESSSFRSFSRANHRFLASDLAHAQLPYEDIKNLTDSDLGMEGYGLPQVMFAWHGEYEWNEEDGASSKHMRNTGYAKNPISIHLTDRIDDCHATIIYDEGRFTEQTVEKILLRYMAVARQMLSNPDIRIADIDILLPGERERLQELSGRDNKVDYPQTTLHDIFHNTASLHPYRPAVIEADGRQTSYAELQEQVLKVAAYLRAQGIEKESVVAVHMKRPPAILASMLGILEAGGAFFLMEGSLPMERLRTMAEQARVTAMITEEGMPIIPGFSERTHTYRDIQVTDSAGDAFLDRTSDNTSLACVIFTSGSTGLPKGALLEHRNLVNYMRVMCAEYGLGMEDRTLQKTLLSFDAAVLELLLPMFTGGAAVCPEPGSQYDMEHLADVIERHRVSFWFSPPAQLQLLLDVPDIEKVNGILRIIACGGEPLTDTLMHRVLATLDGVLYQPYGPTETTLWVTQWKCHKDLKQPVPPIGKPNSNVDIRIMDAMGRPVPPGMSGEIWIGGAQTGRGYINNEEETGKRFVDDPTEPGSGRRYYRTGDLARFLPDGNILFVGRMDDQLKVRGVRIEPGDVTAALLRCAGVREAAVLAEPDGEGSKRLRAWVTLKDGVDQSESTIRTSLTGLLPGYMVPFRIHVIDSIPLTPHGKTDHRALRKIAELEGEGADGLPLTTDTEQRLAAIWSELLGMQVLHRDADFFRLGGHSLSAVRMAGMIHREFHVFLPMTDFYDDGRLERIAAKIDRELGPEGATVDSRIDEYRTYVAWEGTGPGKVYSFFSGFVIIRRMADMSGWKWSVVNLNDPQVQRGETPDQPIEELAPVYADAILREHVGGPLVLMGNCISGIDAYATACLLQERTTDPIHVLLFDTVCTRSPDRSGHGRKNRTSFKRQLQSHIWKAGSHLTERLAERGRKGIDSAGKALRLICREALAYRIFDPEWYLVNYPDVAQAGMDPLSHYLALGWKELRDPSPFFDRTFYKSLCPTFDLKTQNPVLHYLLLGRLMRSVRENVRALHTTPEDMERIMVSGWFDADWYAREFPVSDFRTCHPLYHYMAVGWRFGRKPFPDYDPDLFGSRFPDFESGKTNPLRHLLSIPVIPRRTDPMTEPASRIIENGSGASDPGRSEKGPGDTDPVLFGHWQRPAKDVDILTRRAENRRGYRPGVFHGDLYLFVNQYNHSHNPAMGWQNGPNGRIRSIRMNGNHESYLVDDLGSNVGKVDAIIRDILGQASPAGYPI